MQQGRTHADVSSSRISRDEKEHGPTRRGHVFQMTICILDINDKVHHRFSRESC